MTKILIFSGSIRKESLNKKLAKAAAKLASEAGAEVNYIDLKDFPMPIYDGDLEAESGLPENAIKLKKLFIETDGFLIASPEYNSSIPPLLKNSLDWISRKGGVGENEPALAAYKGKVAALLAASNGALGGLRGLAPLRMMLGNIGVLVLPDQAAIGQAGEAFAEDGALAKENQRNMVKNVVEQLVQITKKIKK